ncbi:MAG: NAD-dependent epimerase/dehydratase family protein [Lachnospiraceae bacterium]|nr:NAD-dependent epimerase/dehydratase family protein [Lachnospiraceae bacterium]
MTAAEKNTDSNLVYLVTGAAGFLGGTVCRQLVERGEKVRTFVLKNDPAVRFVPKEAEIIEGDLTDRNSLERFFTLPEGMESIVLHIASIVTISPEFNQKVMDVNVGGTENIIDLCLSHKECRKLVYCSSTGAIPELPKGEKIAETDSFDAAKVKGCYSQSKALATQMVLDAVHEKGLNACVVHPSGIMGPGDFAISDMTGNVIRIMNGELPAGIDGSFNLCDVRDLAKGLIGAADKGRKGECYILANEEVSFKEFCDILSEEGGAKKVKVFLPIFAANLMGTFMEKQAKRQGKKPLMTSFSVYNLARNNDYDSQKARQELGFTTRPYRETLKDEVRWLKETGKIA